MVSIADLVASSGPLDDPATYATAEQRLLARTWGPVISSRHELQQVAEDAPAPPESSDGRIRIPLTSNDLDGDGRDDVAFFDIGVDENWSQTGVKVTALDGISGRPLWTKDLGDPYNVLVFSPGDVTGDGAEDLLIVVMNITRTPKDLACARPTVCTYDDVSDYTWDIALASGPDGSDRWTRAITGSVRMTGGYALNSGPLVLVARHTEAINALLDIRPTKDIDEDGLPDFLVNAQGYSGELIYHQWLMKEDFKFTTDAEVISGATGASIFTGSIENNPGAALLIPAGDATGDGKSDLLWTVPNETETPKVCAGTVACAQLRTMALEVEVVDGSTFDQAWATDVDDAGIVNAAPVLTGRDLDGDGRSDIVVGITEDDGSQRAVALSGANGAEMWTLNTRLTDPPSALGAIDGGPGTDLLFWEGWNTTAEEAPGVVFRIRLRRVDGATGAELFSTQHDLLEEQDKVPMIFAYPATDSDSDGVPDIAFAVWQYSGWWIENGSAFAVLSIESGRDGNELLHLERDRKALLFEGGNWSTGGAQDLLEGSTTHNDLGFQLSAIEVPGGATLWSHETTSLYSALFGAVRDRSGFDDVLFGRTQLIQDAPHRRSRIDVLRGANGQQVWGVGAPIR